MIYTNGDAVGGWIQVELPEAEIKNQLKMSGGFANEEPDSFIYVALTMADLKTIITNEKVKGGSLRR